MHTCFRSTWRSAASKSVRLIEQGRVWMRHQSLSLPNIFSIECRWRYSTASCGIGTFRFLFDGMQVAMLHSASALRNQSASSPRSPSRTLARGQSVEPQGGSLVVAHLALAQQHDKWSALAVAHGMELGIQPAFGASDTSGNSHFLSRLAAVRCAFRCVASIINWSGLSPFAEWAAKILLNTPSRLHRKRGVKAALRDVGVMA